MCGCCSVPLLGLNYTASTQPPPTLWPLNQPWTPNVDMTDMQLLRQPLMSAKTSLPSESTQDLRHCSAGLLPPAALSQVMVLPHPAEPGSPGLLTWNLEGILCLKEHHSSGERRGMHVTILKPRLCGESLIEQIYGWLAEE